MGRAGSTGNLRWMALAVSGVAVAIAAPLVLLAVTDEDPGPSITYEVTPAPSSTQTTRVGPRPTTTTLPAAPIGIGELPGQRTRVVATEDGIVLAAPDGSLPYRRLTNEPTHLAFGVGEGRVVAQALGMEGAGRVVIRDGRAEHEVLGEGPAHGGDSHELLDARFVGGRPYALVSTTIGASPDTRDTHLLLIDLETLRRLDLGSVAGWEEGVGGAGLLSNGDVVVLVKGTGGNGLERRRLDGTTAWSVTLPEDESTLALQPVDEALGGLQVLVLETSWFRDVDHPRLAVRRFDIETGVEAAAPVERKVTFDADLDVPEVFCRYAEATPDALLCDGSLTPPLRIDLASGRAVPELGFPATGTMTLWRFDD